MPENTQAIQPSETVPLLQRPWAVVAFTVFACALWGSAFAFVKLGYELFDIASDSPAQQLLFAGMRFTLAGLMVLVGTAIARRSWPVPAKEDLVPITLLALSQTTLQYAPFYIGLAHASGTNSALVQGTSAFISILVATLVFRQERLSARKLAACLMGIGGVALVTFRDGGSLGSFSLDGEGLIVVSVTCGAVATCLMRRYGRKGDPFTLTGYQFLLGGSALVLIALLMGGRIHTCPPAAIGVLCYLAALSATAFSIWSCLLKYNPVSHIAVYRFFIPAFGVLFSIVFLGERLAPAQVPFIAGALLLITCGTIIVNTQKGEA
jgi:drug/metabolite transporter (DMT)-like permease